LISERLTGNFFGTDNLSILALLTWLVETLLIILFVIFFTVYSLIERYKEEKRSQEKRKSEVLLIKSHEELLLNNYQFYRLLPEYSKNKFDQRLSRFISSRDFTGRGMEVEPYMKVMIGAAAVKFSLGLYAYNLSGFRRIIIFPEEYHSKITGQYHKGEANAIGIVAFSWKHFQEGLDSPNDNLNLGIHEFAHAYFLQQTHMSGESPFDENNFSKLRYHLQRNSVINDVKNRELFRNYAFRNEMEFFAILGEHFFETPSAFKQEAPKLYDMYGQLLKQDTVLLGM